jgi:hypothetical protein
MMLPAVNYLAVLVSGIVIFMLGGLWYSPVLFAKPWIALMGRTEEELRAEAAKKSMPLMYLTVFICGLVTAAVLAVVINRFGATTAGAGACIGALCWLGFAAATSFGSSLFSFEPRKLWLINSAYNLVSFVIAGVILAVWR